MLTYQQPNARIFVGDNPEIVAGTAALFVAMASSPGRELAALPARGDDGVWWVVVPTEVAEPVSASVVEGMAVCGCVWVD
jgi:hypothetical protein